MTPFNESVVSRFLDTVPPSSRSEVLNTVNDLLHSLAGILKKTGLSLSARKATVLQIHWNTYDLWLEFSPEDELKVTSPNKSKVFTPQSFHLKGDVVLSEFINNVVSYCQNLSVLPTKPESTDEEEKLTA